MHLKELGKHDVARDARTAVVGIGECQIDLILCGHLHRSHVESVPVHDGQHHVVIASAGTATSSRGREVGVDRRANFFNYVYIESDRFIIEEWRYDMAQERFMMHRQAPFSRTPVSIPSV
jgi:hypothetical protein